MRTIVLTREQAENFAVSQPHAIISISDSDREPAAIITDEGTVGILKLRFDDVDNIEQANTLAKPQKNLGGGEDFPGRAIRMFDHAMAREILDFWDAVKDQVDLLMVHCNAGQCRSPAVAAALEKIDGGDDEKWFKTRTPNRLVYRTIMEEFYSPHLDKSGIKGEQADPWKL